MKVGLLGNGGWGTALMDLLAPNHDIRWYMRKGEDAAEFNTFKVIHHMPFSSSRDIPCSGIVSPMASRLDDRRHYWNNVIATSHINDVIENSDIIILAIPTAFIERELDKINVNISDKVWIVTSKGFVDGGTICDYIYKKFNASEDNITYLSGPCHAEEMFIGKRNFLTITGSARATVQLVKVLFSNTNTTITYGGSETTQQELVAAVKNVYAIATGIFDALGYGDNMKAVLVKNAICEMKSLVGLDNIFKTATIGDLLVTCYSTLSRNYKYGLSLINGTSLDTKPEGFTTVRCIKDLISTPIIDFVYYCVYEAVSESDIKDKAEQLINTMS